MSAELAMALKARPQNVAHRKLRGRDLITRGDNVRSYSSEIFHSEVKPVLPDTADQASADIANAARTFSSVPLWSRTTKAVAAYRTHSLRSRVFLRHAEELLRLGSVDADLVSGASLWSKGMYEILGIPPGCPVSRATFFNLVHPDDRERIHRDRLRSGAAGRPFQHTFRVILPDGTEKMLLSRGKVSMKAGIPARLIGVCLDVTEQVQRGKRQKDREARLSRQLMQTRDNERRRFARELHESAGQSLAALKMTLGRLNDLLGQENPMTVDLLKSAISLTEEAIREVRTISYSMYPPMLSEVGVASAVRWYLHGFALRSGIRIQADIRDDFGRCSPEVETSLFHILQEALNNVHRHSGSQMAEVRLWREKAGTVVAEVKDSGRGIDVNGSSGISTPAGVGIAGMRERARLLGGRVDVHSCPSGGTTVRVILPAFVANESHPVSTAKIENAKGRPNASNPKRRFRRSNAAS